MCGFAGILSKRKDVSYDQLSDMQNAIFHRGPDSSGIWLDETNLIGFCHNRLSILDVTNAGSQPMFSNTNRFVVSYNGEIYNHLDLRVELWHLNSNIQFKGNSDTETLLTCFEYWGVEKTVSKLVGMFAFALWDVSTNLLYLCRDRVGEKPLYCGWQGDYFFFCSELKAIKRHPNFVSEVDPIALSMYFRYSYVPAPYSIYKNIKKLNPGSILMVDISGKTDELVYWDFKKISMKGRENSFQGSDSEGIDELDQKLNQAVACQQISDVPIGAFLSGGIDSTLISAIMQSQSNAKINTFTIGFHESKYNEANYAKIISKYLSTNHHELYLSANDIISAVPKISSIFDEPFADSSQLPTYFVCKFAKNKANVVLSGDGGDEFFGGYNRYIQARKFLEYPQIARKLLSNTLSKFSPLQIDAIYSYIEYFLPKSIRTSNAGNHYSKVIALLAQKTEWDLYQSLVSTSSNPQSILKNTQRDFSLNCITQDMFRENLQFENKMMQSDVLTYLPDDVLCKVDRSSMAVSLECRVPFLDHRIVEFAQKLPLNMKIRNGQGKWILRQILNRYVPNQLIERPKMGFGIPLDIWFRGPLRDFAESMLRENDLDEFLDSVSVNQLWSEHLSGKKNHQHVLWNILMFQSWKKEWL